MTNKIRTAEHTPSPRKLRLGDVDAKATNGSGARLNSMHTDHNAPPVSVSGSPTEAAFSALHAAKDMTARAAAMAAAFQVAFNSAATAMGFGPGRAVMIGEHVDKQRGKSIGMALQEGILVALRGTGGNTLNVTSADYGNSVSVNLEELGGQTERAGEPHWARYVRSLVASFSEHLTEKGVAFKPTGAQILTQSDLPAGAGASSSAALLLALASQLLKLWGIQIGKEDLITIAQKTEHRLGASVGRLDQSVIAYAEEGKLVMVDFDTGKVEALPVALGPYRLVMLSTGVERNLAEKPSRYDQRLEWAAAGFETLKKVMERPDLKSPRDVSFEEWEKHQSKLPVADANGLREKKALRHVITEMRRVDLIHEISSLPSPKSVEEQRTRLMEIGRLIDECDRSLAEDYDASWDQARVMVNLARSYHQGSAIDGWAPIMGVRQVGAGWGGNVVAYVHKDEVETFTKEVGARYEASPVSTAPSGVKYPYRLFPSSAGAGLRDIPLPSANGGDSKVQIWPSEISRTGNLKNVPDEFWPEVARMDAATLNEIESFPAELFERWDLFAPLLAKEGFAAHDFVSRLRLQAAIRNNAFSPESTAVKGKYEPLQPEDSVDLRGTGAVRLPDGRMVSRKELSALGKKSRAEKYFVVMVLAGGNASRMNLRQPKATVPVIGDYTFLDLKAMEASAAGLPLVLTTSDKQHAPLEEYVANPPARIGDALAEKPILLKQSLAPGIEPKTGKLALNAEGEPHLYPAGSGAILGATQRPEGEAFRKLLGKGYKAVLPMNIDNLGAKITDEMLGLYRLLLESGHSMICQGIEKGPTDKGGTLLRVDGKVQMVEKPPKIDPAEFPFFSINTCVISTELLALENLVPPERYVEKALKDRDDKEVGVVVQAESIIGELTHNKRVKAAGVMVDRADEKTPDGHFYAVKGWEELKKLPRSLREYLVKRYKLAVS